MITDSEVMLVDIITSAPWLQLVR